MTNVRQHHFIRVQKVFRQLLCKFSVFSIGLKRSLEINISKKGYLTGNKRFWPDFSRITECNKPQETIYYGPEAILTITVDLIRAFFK